MLGGPLMLPSCVQRKHKAKAALCDIRNRDCPAKALKGRCKVILVHGSQNETMRLQTSLV